MALTLTFTVALTVTLTVSLTLTGRAADATVAGGSGRSPGHPVSEAGRRQLPPLCQPQVPLEDGGARQRDAGRRDAALAGRQSVSWVSIVEALTVAVLGNDIAGSPIMDCASGRLGSCLCN